MSAKAQALPFERNDFHEKMGHLFDPAIHKLDRLMASYTFFHLLFLLIAAVEMGFFIAFFSWLGKSTVLAFTLSIFFLTLFSYLVIRLYFQTKKPELLADICEGYIKSYKELLHYQEGIPEHHLAAANALQRLVGQLHEKEYSYYAPPFFLKSIVPTMEKFSAFCHWRDLHNLKEHLLHLAIEEHIKVVKCEPTDLQVHAALANAYVMLSSLYADPRKYEGYDEEKWMPPERLSEQMQYKFRKTAERAIEEFKILKSYAPDDPWVHMQLAYSYHDLQMPDEEIREYETILRLKPDDKETLFKLGLLYFQQGKNAEGLRVFEELKATNFKKAESLIKFYGAFDSLA